MELLCQGPENWPFGSFMKANKKARARVRAVSYNSLDFCQIDKEA